MGKVISEETRRKISESKKGKKRAPFSDEWKRKLSDAGKRKTEEGRKRIGDAHRGKPKSEEQKAKMRISASNRDDAYRAKVSKAHKGKKLSEETKKKLSIAHTGKKLSPNYIEKMKNREISDETRKKLSDAGKGRRHKDSTKEKMRQINLGENNPNWRGGLLDIATAIRHSSKYMEWRQNILIRDDFTCRKCGVRGGILQVHHIKPFSHLLLEVQEYFPLFSLYDAAILYTPLWDLDNGITYCEKCHKDTKHDKKGLKVLGKKKN